jgi:general secretion pathway protein L
LNARVLWHWWVGQLGEWIPDGLRQRLVGRRDVLVVDLGKEGPDAHAVVAGKRHALGHSGPGTTDRWRATLLAALDSLPSRPSTLEIRIPPGSYLRRDLDLPFAAEGNLREAVELQLDRLTPFNPDEVVFQCGVRDRDHATKRLGVWLAAAPAGQVREALEWLGEAPDRAPRPPRGAPPPDGPWVLRYALSRERRLGRGWLLAAANLALLVAVAVAHHQNDGAELLALEGALAEVRRDAAEAAELADTLEQIRGAAVTVQDRRTARPPLVEVLEDLSARLPDDTYLQRFEVRHGEARLFGIAATASNLIRQLEVSPLLADVRFESSVTRDVASGRERFSIVARLVPAAAAAEAREPGT